ncbi:dephospho-CoA kinase [Paraneptunicella aestuarii]|uniref:dephospho-CoA kinase n=1 Tax=Paraneptunicella aestuarii TaxID=2831148 RepID=UPI001E2BDEF8|nr:dephospho-CoA kinase [Paraneptunicella aestuarii]UAA38076.1 dephospho-CoA kinase [Paraneptunicella aestuarii]
MSEFIVGLTGGIGSGKSTVAKLFNELGIDIINADVIAREVVAKGTPALQQIAEKFGSTILTSEQELDRRALRNIVFTDESAKSWLNNLLHPLIREGMIQQTQAAKSQYCILEIPLLVENGLQALVNRVLVVDCPESKQVQRTQERDQAEEAQIKSIMQSQCNRETRLQHADDVIDNSGDIEHLKQQVERLHEQYLLQTVHTESQLSHNSVN